MYGLSYLLYAEKCSRLMDHVLVLSSQRVSCLKILQIIIAEDEKHDHEDQFSFRTYSIF